MAGMIMRLKKPLSPKMVAFVTAYMQTGNATQSALTAGYSKKCPRTWGSRLLKDPRVKAVMQSIPPVPLCPEAYYTREKAVQDYDEAFRGAITDKAWEIAANIVDAKVRLYGLVLEPKEQESGGVAVQNNIYSLGSDDELYDLLRRKREAGNGIDPEATGYHVAGLAETVSQDHRQAVETQAVSS